MQRSLKLASQLGRIITVTARYRVYWSSPNMEV